MRRAIPPLPQYAFMAWCSLKSTGATLSLPSVLQYFEQRRRKERHYRKVKLYKGHIARRPIS